MKTLFLFAWSEPIEDSFFFELEGNYSHLNNTYINSTDDETLIDELNEIVFKDNKDENGYYKVNQLDSPTKDWDFFVKCGFIA